MMLLPFHKSPVSHTGSLCSKLCSSAALHEPLAFPSNNASISAGLQRFQRSFLSLSTFTTKKKRKRQQPGVTGNLRPPGVYFSRLHCAAQAVPPPRSKAVEDRRGRPVLIVFQLLPNSPRRGQSVFLSFPFFLRAHQPRLLPLGEISFLRSRNRIGPGLALLWLSGLSRASGEVELLAEE